MDANKGLFTFNLGCLFFNAFYSHISQLPALHIILASVHAGCLYLNYLAIIKSKEE